MIILDEPTNDLDVETLRSLEEALLNFAGCAMVVSHDRYFLDRVATHILACEGIPNGIGLKGTTPNMKQTKSNVSEKRALNE